MKKLALLAPLGFLAVGVYLFLLAMGSGETVQMIPGHEVPDRFATLLGAIAIFGAIAIGTEAFRASKHTPPTGSRR